MITECPAVPNEFLQPKLTCSDPEAYDRAANRLAAMFVENFKKFEKNSPAYIAAAGPVVLQDQNTKVSETVQTDYPSSKKSAWIKYIINNPGGF